jgi:HD-GYP domain-containing protein (c-di-GMP phosphodiesterase class II)
LSNIIIYTHDLQIGHYFESLMSSLLDNSCEITSDVSYIKSLSKDVALVIVDIKNKEAHNILEHYTGLSKAKPLFIIGDKDSLWQAKKRYKTNALLEYISYDSSIDNIENILAKMLRVSARANKTQSYCKVNLSFFYSAHEIFCDVYLKLKDQKHVKVFNRYDKLNHEDLNKYKNKNINYLYVKERDFQYITKQLVKQLRKVDQTGTELTQTGGHKITALLSIQLQETVAESLNSIGINEDAIEMALSAMTSTLNLVESSPQIYEMLQTSLKGQNYISEHSFLLSYLSCAVCKEIGMPAQHNMQSLTLAAFFHDITLSNDDMAKVQIEREREFKQLGIEEQQEILDHGDHAIDLMKQIEGIPKESLIIVAQHHEQYDGSGFPRGIDFRKISPLSAIFNVCHELCLYIYESGSDEQHIGELINFMEKRYDKGSYKSAIDCLKKIFLSRSQESQLAS